MSTVKPARAPSGPPPLPHQPPPTCRILPGRYIVAVEVAPTGLPSAPWLAMPAGRVPRSVSCAGAVVAARVELEHLRAADVEQGAAAGGHERPRVPPPVLVRTGVVGAAVAVRRRAPGAVEGLPAAALVGRVDLGGEHAGSAGTAAEAAALDDDVAVGHGRPGRVPPGVVHGRLVLQPVVGGVAGDADRRVVGRVAAQPVVTADRHRRVVVRVLHLHGAEQVGVGGVRQDAGAQVREGALLRRVPDVDLHLAALRDRAVAGPVVRRGVGAPAADAAEGLHRAVGGQRHVDRASAATA